MDLHQGDEVTLTGHQAYWYVRGRNENVFNSSSLRLERQKQVPDHVYCTGKKQGGHKSIHCGRFIQHHIQIHGDRH